MRISTAQMQYQGTNAMLDRFNDLAKTQLQLATGKRIVNPSDDPVGITQTLPLKEIISINQQYDKNAAAAEARLTLEDSTLGNITAIVTRVSELAIQGNNDTLSAQDRLAVAQELRQNLATMIGLANTKDGNGDYIFAGDAVDTAPVTEVPAGTFNYNGDSGQRKIQIGATRQVDSGDPGDAVFMNIPFSGGGTQSVFDTVYNFIVDLEANNPNSTVLTDLQSATDTILQTRAKAGARLNAIDSQKLLNEELIFQSQKTMSSIEDLDIAEAVSRLNLQLVGLQASQQSFTRIQNLSLFNYL